MSANVSSVAMDLAILALPSAEKPVHSAWSATVRQRQAIANLREAYGGTAIASLEWQIYEAAVDKVAASGKCQPLGVALWKAKYQRSETSIRMALGLLQTRVGARYQAEPMDIVTRISSQAITEYVATICAGCNGRRSVIIEEKLYTCTECKGLAIKRWPDSERAKAMQLSYGKTKALAHKIAWTTDLISDLDGQVNYVLNVELGRFEI